MAKTAKNDTALTRARQHLTDVRASIDSLTDELAQLNTERDALDLERDRGSLTFDVDRLDELEQTLIPRRSDRLDDLRDRIEPAAVQAVTAAELAEMATSEAGGFPSAHAELQASLSVAVAKATEAAQEYRAAVEAWNSRVTETSTRAQEAGLINGKCDPLVRVQTQARSGYGAHRPTVYVDGEEYTTLGVGYSIRGVMERAADSAGVSLRKLYTEAY